MEARSQLRHRPTLRKDLFDSRLSSVASQVYREVSPYPEHARRSRVYTPRTNGKAERFIQTAIREWAYARRYENSKQRRAHLKPWTHLYNWHRPHASLD